MRADTGKPVHLTPAKRIFCLTIEQVEALLDQAGKVKRAPSSRKPAKPSSRRKSSSRKTIPKSDLTKLAARLGVKLK